MFLLHLFSVLPIALPWLHRRPVVVTVVVVVLLLLLLVLVLVLVLLLVLIVVAAVVVVVVLVSLLPCNFSSIRLGGMRGAIE